VHESGRVQRELDVSVLHRQTRPRLRPDQNAIGHDSVALDLQPAESICAEAPNGESSILVRRGGQQVAKSVAARKLTKKSLRLIVNSRGVVVTGISARSHY
jgi:hypothetical protein